MTRQAEAAILAAIAAEGPIDFARFMDLALYGPGGYYEHPPVGPSGDFVTSPHVHEVFSTLLARAVEEMRAPLGNPKPIRIVEVGAGDGTLARQLLDRIEGDVDYTAVERSSGARRAMAKIEGVHPTERLDLPGTHVVLAHELLDNLPFRVLRGDMEVRIGLDGDSLVETLTEPGKELLPSIRTRVEGDAIVPTGALAFIDELGAGLADAPAYALLIDYGGVGEAGGPLHGYRGHRIVEDVLASPGDNDITAGVDFALIAARAEERGLKAFPSLKQHDVLMTLGFEDWIREELSKQHQQLDARDGLAAVRTWSGRSRANLLVDPAGLGRLRWLLLATRDLPEPPWVARALNGVQAERRPTTD